MLERVLLSALLVSVNVSSLLAQREIPDNNLGYPVLINLTNCIGNNAQGSGFFLNTGTLLYLVTARHVLYTQPQPATPQTPAREPQLQCKTAELRSYSKDPKDQQQNVLMLDLATLANAGRVKKHPTHDVAVVQIGSVAKATPATSPGADPSGSQTGSTVGGELSTGVLNIQASASGMLFAALDTIQRFDQVFIANEVYVFGYPSSIGVREAPQIDYNAPLLRKGSISGLNRANQTIVLDAMTFHGNSGGPVVEVIHEGAFHVHFYVIGIVSQYVPVAEPMVNLMQNYTNWQVYNSGYTIAEPMDPVLELVGQ